MHVNSYQYTTALGTPITQTMTGAKLMETRIRAELDMRLTEMSKLCYLKAELQRYEWALSDAVNDVQRHFNKEYIALIWKLLDEYGLSESGIV